MYFSHRDNNEEDYDPFIAEKLKKMFDEHNVLAKSFRMVKDIFNVDQNINVKLRLIARRAFNARTYNASEVDEVTALIVENIRDTPTNRDIIIKT